MTIFLVIAAAFLGAIYGYSVGADHCNRHRHDDPTDEETPHFRGPY